MYTINKKVEVRKAPGDRFKVLETLQPNSKLIFLNKEEKWYKIRYTKVAQKVLFIPKCEVNEVFLSLLCTMLLYSGIAAAH